MKGRATLTLCKIAPGAKLRYFERRRVYTRPLRKLATDEQVQGAYGAQNRNVHEVHEDLSTGATQQLPSVVEFTKEYTTY